MKPPSKPRPNMLLWLVSKVVLIVMPLTIAITFIPLAFGIEPNIFIFGASALVAWMISDFYDTLTLEVRDYIQEKYNDQASN